MSPRGAAAPQMALGTGAGLGVGATTTRHGRRAGDTGLCRRPPSSRGGSLSKHHRIVWPLAPGELGALQPGPALGLSAGLAVRASAHGVTLALGCWAGLGGQERAEGWGWGFRLSFLSSLEVKSWEM